MTIIGAVSSKQESFVYHIGEATNAVEVRKFLMKLKQWVLNPEKTIVVADNHIAHSSPIVKKYLNNAKINVLFLPPSSSALNPIGK